MTMLSWAILLTTCTLPDTAAADQQFEQLAARYMDEFPAPSPVSATALGDHRFDSLLDDVSAATRQQERDFCLKYLEELKTIDPAKLSRAHQVDHALLTFELQGSLWRLDKLQEWAWNPLVYTGLCGSAIYNLMAREFAPLPQRLEHVSTRLEQFPRLYQQIRETLEPKRVPKIHAETAVKQNRGVLSILDNLVQPHVAALPEAARNRLVAAMSLAKKEVEQHQQWLETELLPNAAGDFRLGAGLFDQKLAYTLKSPLTRQQVRERAERELLAVRDAMYRVAQEVYQRKFPYTEFPETPSRAYQQAIIRSALEMAYLDSPPADALVDTARKSLALCTEFVRATIC